MNHATPKPSYAKRPRMSLLLGVAMLALAIVTIVVLVTAGVLSLVKVMIAVTFVVVMGGFMHVLTWPERH